MPILIRIALITLLASASACGWHLRGGSDQSAPTHIHLITGNPYAPLILSLKKTMQQRAITNDSNAPLQLQIGEETLHKSTVAVTNIGSPAQYELSLSVKYHYFFSHLHTGTFLPKSISVERVFDFDPSNTVAKSEEEDTLLSEMRSEIAHRILQQASKQIEP